ncbi:MAG: MATE family efflux transporter [Flavobacteriales bacterium]|nr:MATE family efflux transporter [Flavobacteriales bacterium]MDG1440833.1 MATE family efflux transporter [Flavobacteriales bacterium]
MLDIKEIRSLAIPAIIYNITEPLIGLADTAIIGQIDQEATIAQGAVGLAAGLIATLIWGFAQMRTSLSAIVSRQYGSNQINRIKSLIPQTIILTFLTGVLISFVFGVYFKDISKFLFGNMEAATFQYSKQYFTIRCYGLPLGLAVALFFGIYRGLQNTYWAMYVSIVGGVSNILLDYILVLGIDDVIDPMGVKGAAWASVISQIIMTSICILIYLQKTPFNFLLNKKLNPYFKEMLFIFINMFIRTMVLNFVFIISNRFANSYGNNSLAAYTIGYNIWIFSAFFIDGYSNAGNALAGKYIGEKNNEKLKSLGSKLIKINIKISFLLMIFYTLLYPFIGEFFNSNKLVIKSFESFFWIVIIAQPLNSIAFTFDGIFKGLGKAVDLRNTLIIGTFLFYIPSVYILDFIYPNLISIWVALSVWMLYRGLSLFLKFKKITSF